MWVEFLYESLDGVHSLVVDTEDSDLLRFYSEQDKFLEQYASCFDFNNVTELFNFVTVLRRGSDGRVVDQNNLVVWVNDCL